VCGSRVVKVGLQAAQLTQAFEDKVGGLFEGVGVGSSDEAWLGGPALVVDFRQSLSHHGRDGVRHSDKFNGRQSLLKVPPVAVVGEGGLQQLVLAHEPDGSGEIGRSTEKGQTKISTGRQ
jgi:hypothetical protein